MFSAISSALSGLNDSVSRVSNAISSIVNASSTSAAPAKTREDAVTLSDAALNARDQQAPVDVTSKLLDAKLAQVTYSANAAVIKATLENDKRLLDTLA